MTRRTVNLLQFWLTIGFLSLPGLAFAIAGYIRFRTALFPEADVEMRSYAIFIVLVTALWAYVVERLALNRISTLLALRTGIITAAKASACCMVVALSILFFYRTISFARMFVVVGCLLLFAFSVFLIHLFRQVLHAADKFPNGRFSIAVVGADQHAMRVAHNLSKGDATRCKVGCFVALPNQPHAIEDAPVLPWERLEDVIDVYHCSEVLICVPPDQIGQSQDVLRAVQHLCIPARMVLDLGDGVFVPERVFDYYGIPLLDLRPYPVDTIAYCIGKRLFDIVFSTCVLVLSLPLTLTIALAIKLTSAGPVFFVQERISLNGRRFKMIKFRSMYLQNSQKSNEQHTTRFDARITPVGRILRRTSLDEFPQFLNVLLGDMSVVGPRPELTFFVQKFRSEIPWYMARHNVKPGITGWAQVNGLRGSDTSIVRRVEFDLQYMQHWSMFLDLRIILMTLTSGILTSQAF